MSFLVLLLVLWVEKFSSWRRHIQCDGLWNRWFDHIRGKALGPWLALTLMLGVPLLLAAVALGVLGSYLHGWLALPLHLLILIYALGRGDVLERLGAFRDAWRRGDQEAAFLAAQRDLQLDAEGSPQQLLPQVQGYLLWQGYQGFFAVIFWYVLLGPLLALAYRLLDHVSRQSHDPSLQEKARLLRHALDWLPVRALSASFALVGNFVAVARQLLHVLLAWEVPAAGVLAQAGRAAAEIAEPRSGEEGVASLDGLWQLLVRSAILWYALIAVWVIWF